MRILLVDDHPIVREGYRRLFERQQGWQVVGEAGTVAEALATYQRCRPDIVLLDMSLPDAGGVEALSQICRDDPLARVLVFTMHHSPSMARMALKAGARGYVTKDATPADVIDALRRVGGGRIALSADIAHAIAIDGLTRPSSPLEALTAREIEIFRGLAQGRSIAELAAKLGLTTKTVHNHRTQLKAKLDAASDAHLVLLALEHGLLPLASGRAGERN